MRTRDCISLSLGFVALLGCSPRGTRGADSSSRAGSPGAKRDTTTAAGGTTDSASLARLEHQARALASTSGCSSRDQCKTAPLGAKACGGPREWLVYCATSTDSAALFRKLTELKTAEEAFNRAHNVMSTCEYRMPPVPVAEGGRCK